MVIVDIDLREFDVKRSRISIIAWTLIKLEEGGIKARPYFGGPSTYGTYYPIEPGTLGRKFLTNDVVRFTWKPSHQTEHKPAEPEPQARPAVVIDEAKREATVQALATHLAQSEARKYRLSPEQTQQAYQRHLQKMQRRASLWTS